MIDARRAIKGALLLSTAFALPLAGCNKAPIACDSDGVKDKVVAAARAEYPNAASNDLLKRGSVAALEHILQERHLDRNNPDDVNRAAQIAVDEAKVAYQNGRFTLENIDTVATDAASGKISCRARMMMMNSWGIAVREVTYDAETRNDEVEVKLGGLQ